MRDLVRKAYLPWQYGMQLGLPKGLAGLNVQQITCLATGSSLFACDMLRMLSPHVRVETPFTLHDEMLTPGTLLVTLSESGESADVIRAWRKSLGTPVEQLVLTSNGPLRREAKGRVPVLPLPDSLPAEVGLYASIPLLLRIEGMLFTHDYPLESVLGMLKRAAEQDETLRFAEHLATAVGKRFLLGIAVDDSPGLRLLGDVLLSTRGMLSMSLPLSSAVHTLPAFLREQMLAVDDVFFLFLREAEEDSFTSSMFEQLRMLVQGVKGESMTLILKGARLVRWMDMLTRILLTGVILAEREEHVAFAKPALQSVMRKLFLQLGGEKR